MKINSVLAGCTFLMLMSCSDSVTDKAVMRIESDTVKNLADIKAEEKFFADTVDRNIYWNIMGQYDKLPRLEFEEISKSEYLKYKKIFHSSFVQDSSLIAFKDSSFTILTSKAKLNFVSEYNKDFGNRSGFSWTNYKGYIKPLHLYVMEGWTASGGGYTGGDLFLIDSTTNISYTLPSNSDFIFEVRTLSPDGKHIAIVQYTSIEIGEIINTNGILSYKSIAYGDPGDMQEVIWVNDHKIAMKISTRESNPVTKKMDETISYVVADIPLKE